MNRFFSFSYRAALLGLPMAFLAACPSDEPAREQVSLASLSAVQRERMVHSVIGFDANALLFIVGAIDATSVCPKVTDSGTSRTAVGGCTDDEGVQWQGEIRASNITGAVDRNKTVSLRADGFGFKESAIDGEDVEFDGTVDLVPNKSMTVALTTTAAGEALRIDLKWTSLDSPRTVTGTVEIVGRGYADVTAEWDASPPSGSIELRGRDVFTVDVSKLADNATGEDCAPGFLDGVAAGQVCDF